MATLATLVVKIAADSEALNKGLDDAEKRANGVSSRFGKALAGAGKAAIVGGLAVAAVGIGAVTAVLSDAIPLAADFQSQLVGLEIAASSSGIGFDQLHDAALQVGGDTALVGVSATGAADAMTGLYKAGLTTTEIFGDLNGYMAGTAELGGALRGAIDLAAATELDMVQASDLAAVALATFGGELETEAERAEFITGALDNMVKAADASVAEVSDLAAALKNVGPTAGALGVPIEDVNNALAILSTRGINGAEAGTQLKSMLANLQRPTDAVTATLDKLGISLYDAEGVFVGLPALVGNLESSFSTLTDEERNLAAQTLAGTFGMNALNTLLAEGSTGWADMAEATANAAGIQEQAAAKADSFAGRMEALDGTIETLKIGIGEAFLPVGQQLAEWLATMVETHGPAIVSFFGVIQAGIAEFGAALGLGMDPLMAFMEVLDTFIPEETMVSLYEIEQGIRDLIAGVSDFMEPIAAWISSHVKLQDVLIALGVAIAAVLIPIIIGLVTTLAPIILAVAAVIAIAALLRTAWEENWGGIQEAAQVASDFLQGVFDFIVQWVALAFERIQQVYEAFSLAFEGDWRGFGEKLREIWDSVWELITNILGSLWDTIKPILSDLWISLKGWWNGIEWSTLGQSIIDGIVGGISRGVSAITNAARNVAQAALDAAKGFLGIQSPSAAFAELGRFSVAGFAAGLGETGPAISAAGGLGSAALGVSGGGGNFSGGPFTINIYGDSGGSIRAEVEEALSAYGLQAAREQRIN